MFGDEDEFWEEMNGIIRKNMEEEVEMKNGMNFDNKYKRRRERDEDTGERGIYKKNTVSKYFENSCELLANGN
jgi:hypothetical protein